MLLARALLAQGRPDRALALLDRLHAATITQDRTGSVIEAGALRALALAASGDDAAAVNALAGALTLACPEGYVRVIADEGTADGRAAGPGWSRRSGPAILSRPASRWAAWAASSVPLTPTSRELMARNAPLWCPVWSSS